MEQILTSESVNIGHPDKTCDYIADCFLDEALTQDPQSQMAVECAIKNNHLFIYGEATTNAKINYAKIARKALKEIGYKNRFKIKKVISSQSPDIADAVKKSKLCANDQGVVFGYATNETSSYLPLTIEMAHYIMKVYDDFRKEKMQALKEKDKLKNKVITNILSDLIYIKKELGQEPTEADSAKAVAKQVKQVKDAKDGE